MTKRAVLLFSSLLLFFYSREKKECKILTITYSLIGCKLLQNRVYGEIRKEFSFFPLFFLVSSHPHYDWPVNGNIRLVEPIPSFSLGRFLGMF
jgi:hypothetical protein